MLFYYIRHGDPIYHPDSLTPLGQRQAEAVGKRLAMYGVDKIYTSSSIRAIETAKPACEMLKLESEQLDFANEHYAWLDLTVDRGDGEKVWVFADEKFKMTFTSPEMKALGENWYEHPDCKGTNFKNGFNRIADETDKFLASLGFEHIRHSGRYKVTEKNDKRVALFAHHGFGMAFLSCLLDIPYPIFSTHFDITYTGMTVIDFDEKNDICIPRVLMHSADSHLYKEGLPTKYNHTFLF